jgi:hypothetical protein
LSKRRLHPEIAIAAGQMRKGVSGGIRDQSRIGSEQQNDADR